MSKVPRPKSGGTGDVFTRESAPVPWWHGGGGNSVLQIASSWRRYRPRGGRGQEWRPESRHCLFVQGLFRSAVEFFLRRGPYRRTPNGWLSCPPSTILRQNGQGKRCRRRPAK
jgi:hypothetical protein